MAPRHMLIIVIVCVGTMLLSSKLAKQFWNNELERNLASSSSNNNQTNLLSKQDTNVQGRYTLNVVKDIKDIEAGAKVTETDKGDTKSDGKHDISRTQHSNAIIASSTVSNEEQGNHSLTNNGNQEDKPFGLKTDKTNPTIPVDKEKDVSTKDSSNKHKKNKGSSHQESDKPSSCKAKFVNFTEEEDLGSFRKAGPKTYVYSAYYDARPEAKKPNVKIIAMSSENVTIFCNLWYGNKGYSKVTTVKADIIVPIGRKGATLETVIFLCSVDTSDPDAGIPQWVVFSESPCGPPKTELPISNLHARSLQYNFTVCLHKAFMEGYNNSAQFVEWVEVNRIFGAGHFLVYNFSSGLNLLPYIQYYVKEGIMEYRNWPVKPFELLIENWKGQNGVMFDCTYRYMFRTKYMIMTDVDEIVVPRKHKTFNEMVINSPCRNNSAINIKQVMFSILYDVNPEYAKNKNISRLNLNSLAHTLRRNFSWPCGIRSKLMVQPDHALYPGCHMSMMPNECCMPDDVAQLHHYRWFNDTIYDHWSSRDYFKAYTPWHSYFENKLDDGRLYEIKDQIVNNVAKVYKAVDGI